MPDRKCFQPEVETMPARNLRAMQLERLKDVVERAYLRSDFYRMLYDQAGVRASDITTLEDIQRLPLLEKRTLGDAYPAGTLLAAPGETREVHGTSGTTQKPILVFATKNDIDYWADLTARELWMVGLRPGDTLLNSYGYGLPTGGFGFHYGAIKMGMTVIPSGPGHTDRQIQLLTDLPVTAVSMTPSFALFLGKRAREKGINLATQSSCRVGLFGAERWTWSARGTIEELLGITAYDEFGMTEFLGPGMACECETRDRTHGMHAWADAFLVECINPATGEWVPEGQSGELVWTWLTAEGTCMIRYRSRDLSSLTWDPCPCGRTHPRIAAITGRTDDAVTIGGFICFPSQVGEVLARHPEVGKEFRMIVDRDERGLDRLTLSIEVADPAVLAEQAVVRRLTGEISSEIRSTLGVTPKSTNFLAPGALPRTAEGKGDTTFRRVEDKRP